MSNVSYPTLPPRSSGPPSPQLDLAYAAAPEIPAYEQLDAAPQASHTFVQQPPPQHSPVPAQQQPAPKQTFFMKASENKWAKRATKISDAIGVRANAVGEKFGAERFWPTTGDGYLELKKCARILTEFTAKGLPTSEKPAGKGKARQITKVYKKIPPSIIRNAKGIVIFSCFRSGFAPLAGSGGSGVVMIRLPNGQWSAPAFVAPNNISGGLMFGADAYNAILILNSDEAVHGFKTHHFTIGSEVAIAAGPLGAGAGMDTGVLAGKRAPIYTYVVSRGLYAGIELTGQIFVEREEETEIVYQRKGLRTTEILSGSVTAPPEAQPLFDALYQAEHGIAQGAQLEQEMTAEEAKEKDMPDTHDGTESRPA